MLGHGLTLTVIGMGIVFVFLTLLVILMTLMSRIVGTVEKKRADQINQELALKDEETFYEEEAEQENELSEIAAAIGVYLRAGGVLPALDGEGREDIAALVAALAAAGGPVPKGNNNEIAAALAAIRAYK